MSSSQILSQILAELQANRAEMLSLKAEVSTLRAAAKGAPAPVAAKKAAKKERDPDAPKREPTAWRLFADRVRDLLRTNGYTGNAIGVECVQFCSTLKEENSDLASWSDADILARRADWSKPEISKGAAKFGQHWVKNKAWRKGSAANSVASEEADGGGGAASAPASDGEAGPAKAEKQRKNPWAGLSEEQKAERIAKMKAGKAAKKAASEGEADVVVHPPPAPAALVVVAEAEAASVTSSEKKKRGPKKHADMTPEELAADKAKRAAKKEAKKAAVEAASAEVDAAARVPLPASPASSVGASEYQRIVFKGKPYLVNMETGYCYHRLPSGAQGEWAGLFSKTPMPHIDDSVAEPEDGELVFGDE